jgi:hypothetical protein
MNLQFGNYGKGNILCAKLHVVYFPRFGFVTTVLLKILVYRDVPGCREASGES